MINISDIEVGKKYGFDIRVPVSHETHRDSLYEEGVVVALDDNGDSTFVIFTMDNGKSHRAFDFRKLLRLVGPFSDE
jgi:hypothetical protein